MAYTEQVYFYRFPNLPVVVCVIDTNGYYASGVAATRADLFDEAKARASAELNARRYQARLAEKRAALRAERAAELLPAQGFDP